MSCRDSLTVLSMGEGDANMIIKWRTLRSLARSANLSEPTIHPSFYDEDLKTLKISWDTLKLAVEPLLLTSP